ncbi:hypothetical protein N7535_008488 [Penicillium sp. DV-2018c]|nr:hypothetical protein N7461_002248 [Penicillium sp. DV-2018c]KAJ5563324.1 hypothetical protein N7535_008488 [Penicillium sp. DV-2018c]
MFEMDQNDSVVDEKADQKVEVKIGEKKHESWPLLNLEGIPPPRVWYTPGRTWRNGKQEKEANSDRPQNRHLAILHLVILVIRLVLELRRALPSSGIEGTTSANTRSTGVVGAGASTTRPTSGTTQRLASVGAPTALPESQPPSLNTPVWEGKVGILGLLVPVGPQCSKHPTAIDRWPTPI